MARTPAPAPTAPPAASPDDVLVPALRAAGLRVTTQRLVLFRALHELGHHVTADEVATAVADRLPALSLPTVYAALERFAELGLVRRVQAGPGAVRWDPRSEPHAHFACAGCGRVLDVDGAGDAGALLR